MWQLQLGYVLHPSIPESIRTKPDLKIADVACGNGAWLFELQAPETSQLDGYDLSANCFGAKEWLAKNVTLTGDFDALKPLHESLKGQYDIVHIRAVVSIIKNNNVKPLVETLMGLLSKYTRPIHTNVSNADLGMQNREATCNGKMSTSASLQREYLTEVVCRIQHLRH
jgi:2-polyprenyl-3-methyl-5-hydroxy-6-metoxy-1,4-benzoquinol methylase